MPATQLTVYLRRYCHLCHDLIDRLQPYQEKFHIQINQIDIDTNSDLEARYGELIPFLAGADDVEICHYFLDEAALTAYLTKIR